MTRNLKLNAYSQQLEAQALSVIYRALSEYKNTALLFSGGKDSAVLAHLVAKALYPEKIPVTFLMIDTGHNFIETLEFIKKIEKKYNILVQVGSVPEAIQQGVVTDVNGLLRSRNKLQSVVLNNEINKNKFQAVFGGGRRDEEKARAKEKIFSVRDGFGAWKPEYQRAEFGQLYNLSTKDHQHFRVFPLSHWTELDIWNYILNEKIELPSLYFSHLRKCVIVDGKIWPHSEYTEFPLGSEVRTLNVRCRTVGDMTCTALIESSADTVEKIIFEIQNADISERGLRLDDQFSETAMEDRKKEGYF